MKDFLIALSLFIAALPNSISYAGETKWQTNITLNDGRVATLFWIGVYEGSDTLYKISVEGNEFHLGKRNTAGQPVINLNTNLVALPYCADDGCGNKINIFDLTRMDLLKPIILKYEGQFYITCKWNDMILNVEVEHAPFNNKKESFSHYKFKIDPHGTNISIKK